MLAIYNDLCSVRSHRFAAVKADYGWLLTFVTLVMMGFQVRNGIEVLQERKRQKCERWIWHKKKKRIQTVKRVVKQNQCINMN